MAGIFSARRGSLSVDAMMAGVGGNVVALVFAALVALPVGPESAGWRSDVLLRDRSTLAVAGTARGTVLARVKALRFAWSKARQSAS